MCRADARSGKLKKEIKPGVFVVVIVLALAVIGVFFYRGTATPGPVETNPLTGEPIAEGSDKNNQVVPPVSPPGTAGAATAASSGDDVEPGATPDMPIGKNNPSMMGGMRGPGGQMGGMIGGPGGQMGGQMGGQPGAGP